MREDGMLRRCQQFTVAGVRVRGGGQRPRDEHGNVYKSQITETQQGCEVEISPEPSCLIEYSEKVR